MDEKFKEYVKNQAISHISYIHYPDVDRNEAIKALIEKCRQIIVGESLPDDSVLNNLLKPEFNDALRFIKAVIVNRYGDQDVRNKISYKHPLAQKLIKAEYLNISNDFYWMIGWFISEKLIYQANLNLNEFIEFLKNQKFTDDDIIKLVMQTSNSPFYVYHISGENQQNKKEMPSKFGEYVLKLIEPKKGFLGIKKETGYKQFIEDFINKNDNEKGSRLQSWFKLLYNQAPEKLDNDYYKYIAFYDSKGKKYINVSCLFYVIEKDAIKFESLVLKALGEGILNFEMTFPLIYILNEKLNGKYHQKLVEISENHLKTYFVKPASGYYPYSDLRCYKGNISHVYFEYLLRKNEANGKARIEQFLNEANFVFHDFFDFLEKEFGGNSLSYLIECIDKQRTDEGYYKKLFGIIEKYDFREFIGIITSFMVNSATAKTREIAAKIFIKFPDEALAEGSRLLSEKTVNQRISGALILAATNSEKSDSILNNAVDTETNDDTRDIMLEALAEQRFSNHYTLEMVMDMVEKANSRKKLSKWNEIWVDEEKLPKLFWKERKMDLSQNHIRFLFYRMKRAQGLNSDIEARQMLLHIDKEKSNAFAKYMLQAFQDSNADPKLKYYLTIAGLLGDDDIMHSLNVLFKKNMADKRMKMAEYVIGALAMVGTNKALRSVEVIYRKFANKKPAISTAAKDALTAAANELNISMDELADRIIPDFGFDGLYKTFEVEGEEYRAFINSDFSINYLNEENKIRKSIPTNAPKELKTEFKEIEKEVRDIVKSQSDRLERYMLEERRWPATVWHDFFFMNPIMFIYALKLVWGVFDKDGKLLDIFYCSEDTSLYNRFDEEIHVNEDHFVGIIHPIYLSDNELQAWKDKVYDLQLSTIFPIFERQIYNIADNEKELNLTNYFYGKDVPKGADFVNTYMVKKNWRKSTGDGGSSEFTKHYRDGQLKAYANIEGPMAFYQGGDAKATVHQIAFIGKNWNDKIKLKEVPALFYSEVISDIDQLIKIE
jgi:hypothetical protein